VQALRHDPQDGLREGARGATAGRSRLGLRRILAVSELALAVVLVIGAGLMARTFRELRAIETGFEPSGVLSMTLALPSSSYSDDASVVAFFDRLVREVEALSGVEEAAVTRRVPLAGTIGDWSIDIEGYEEQPGENPHGDWQVVSPGYFEAMGIRLADGRFLTDEDHAASAPVVVVNRTMAESYWPEGALGKRFRTSGEWATIVGIVEDVRHNALVEEPRTEMYHPHAQYPVAFDFAPREMSLVVKGEGDPSGLMPSIRGVVRAMDASLPLSDVRTMDGVLSDAVAEQRFTMSLLGVFGVVAVLLAVVGIYGILSYSVSKRTHEMGIRLALGAERGTVVALVVADGFRIASGGLLLGVLLALALTRLMTSLLYAVEPLDPLTFLAVPGVLGVVALVATWIPAWRASRVPPAEALRTG
jgi:putative ABC transport system permease protein